jgi:hypothetical protein
MFLEDRLKYTTVLLPHEFIPDLDPFDSIENMPDARVHGNNTYN